jgi:L-cysteate sulfo-lyase
MTALQELLSSSYRQAADSSPRLELIQRQSPLERMARLGDHLGRPHLFVKRDDEGGRGGGGNKLRKFERQFGQALDQGADTFVIAAHPQSNAARELVGCAVRFGFRTVVAVKELVPRETPAFRDSGNALLLELLGTEFVRVPANEEFAHALERIAVDLRRQGAKPYVLPFGASNQLGTLGYADCADEIIAQSRSMMGREPDIIGVATGTGGTHAGLLTGVVRAGVQTRVVGFEIGKFLPDAATRVRQLTDDALAVEGLGPVPEKAVVVDRRACGEGYGFVTPDGVEAIRLVARLEGLFLEPVYTGKAMAGLLSYLETEAVPKDALVVFVHTGGLPLLFAYPDAFWAGRQ